MNIIKYIKHPPELILLLDRKMKILHLLPDKIYLKLVFRIKTHKKLNLRNPQTFNEKLQWLKLYDRQPIYTTMVDKYEAKKYVASIIGDKYIIPTLGVYDKFDDINFDKLPNQFVIKCTHDSGGLVIVRNKSELDIDFAKDKINRCLKKNYYYSGREWPYKNVKPRVIVEKYMSNNGNDLVDYKFFDFHGIPKIVLVCSERSKDLKETWFNENFEKLDLREGGHAFDNNIRKPKELNEMIKLSKKIARSIPFVRTDFYIIDNKVYFGEITFYPASGFEMFEPELYNNLLGSWIDLKN